MRPRHTPKMKKLKNEAKRMPCLTGCLAGIIERFIMDDSRNAQSPPDPLLRFKCSLVPEGEGENGTNSLSRISERSIKRRQAARAL